jgi:hypothetical protein
MRLRTGPVTLFALSLAATSSAQHAAFRIKGRVVTEAGAAVRDAEVRIEAFYGYGAGTFSGQRLFSTRTDGKGAWSMGALQPGVWLFEVIAPGFLPEMVALPPRLLTTVSQGTSGMSMTWDLVLKPEPLRDDGRGLVLMAATDAAREGKSDEARSALVTLPMDADADYLAAAGRIAMLARDTGAAATLFKRAIDRDPANYRAALGAASTFLLQRDFDSASRAFDAARNRTHDKDEQRFISAAIGELAAIKYR